MTDGTEELDAEELSAGGAAVFFLILISLSVAGVWLCYIIATSGFMAGPSTSCADVSLDTAAEAEAVLLYQETSNGVLERPGSGSLTIYTNGTYLLSGVLGNSTGNVSEQRSDLYVVPVDDGYLLVDRSTGYIEVGPEEADDSSSEVFGGREEYDIYDTCEATVT